MHPLLWIGVGIAVGAIATVPIVRRLLRRAEYRARLAERRARESERLAELGSMTGGLAHEIKNPLSTIGLNAQLLTEGIEEAEMPEDQRERLLRRLGALAREAERLKGILTDFLQFAGRIKLDPQPLDLVRIVEDIGDFFHPQCDQAGVMLRMQPASGPVIARVDDRLFKQALLNLMINAVQAMTSSEPGAGSRELIVRVDRNEEGARVEVTDTGPGIEPDKLDRIFHPYVSHSAGGTGLGLPTARRIIEEHGGRLEVSSVVGRGSSFVIHLPENREGA